MIVYMIISKLYNHKVLIYNYKVLKYFKTLMDGSKV